MKSKYIVSLLASTLSVSVFALQQSPCHPIVKSCLSAGYTMEVGNKNIWKDCMKPVILGQIVKDVTVDKAVVKACRQYKIKKMKKDLREFERAS